MANSKVIYSTDSDYSINDKDESFEVISPRDQKVRIHLDRKGGGKIVSVVKGLKEHDDKIKLIAKELKKACGVGGAAKGGEILIQGNHREKIQALLKQKGYDAKLSGG